MSASVISGKTPYRATTKELMQEAAVMLIAAAGIACVGSHTFGMTIFIAFLLIARFSLLYRRGDLIVFLLGILLGGGNDVISMWKGVYWYTPSTLLPVPIPAWMVIFWGEAFLFFRRLMRYPTFLADETIVHRIDLPMALDLIMLLPLKMMLYRCAAIPWVPDVLFAMALLLRYLIVPPMPHERRLLLTILILGPFYEALLIYSGLYVYQHGIFLGMPLWLIVYWIYIFRILKAFQDRLELRLATQQTSRN